MKIELYHDTACPWCRIGKAHLQAALDQWDGEVKVTYHTYFLNPTIPAEGYPFREYMNAKGGGQVPLEQWFAAPRQAGERAGLTFNFEDITHAPNTLLSHRLIALVPESHTERVMDAIYAAYFEQGRNIGDIEVLVAIADEQDLDPDDIRAQLDGDAAEADVLADAQRGQQIGISGVPFFIIDERLAFNGAQPPETILRVLQQAAQTSQETT